MKIQFKLSTYYMPGTVVEVGYMVVNKTDIAPALRGFTVLLSDCMA